MRKLLSIFLLICFAVTLSTPCSATENADVSSLRDEILTAQAGKCRSKNLQEWLNSTLIDLIGTGGETFAYALKQSGEQLDYSLFSEKLKEYVKNNSSHLASTSKEFMILTIVTLSESEEELLQEAKACIGQQGLMSYVYGVHLLNNGVTFTEEEQDDLFQNILERQLPDGGWAVTGNAGDVDATAMVLESFASVSQVKWKDSIIEAKEKALQFLSSQQKESGEFQSFGVENLESTAQVWIALSAWNIDALSDERFIKNGNTVLSVIQSYETENGRYSHVHGETESTISDIQAYCSFVAYLRMVQEQGPLYVYSFDNPIVRDNRVNLTGKQIVLLVVIVICTIWIGILLVKKKSKKHIFSVLMVGGCLALFIGLIRIESKDNYYQASQETETNNITTYIEIRCDVVKGQKDYLPRDGSIVEKTEVKIPEDSTAYDQLVEICKQQSIQLDVQGLSSLAYIRGIQYLYEFDFGDLSGWVFSVNGNISSVGCGQTVLKEGDVVCWDYTLTVGKGVEE